tara:strand:- start:212 stop:547 length:336 start_codon:yes stop_codon:yes gene_type:complete
MSLREWNGPKISNKIVDVVKLAMDDTMAKCVVTAKAKVPVRTGTLQGSIQMRETRIEGQVLTGLWGSFNVKYAIYVEMGTGRMSAQPYLRPAADQHYPELTKRIKALMKKA